MSDIVGWTGNLISVVALIVALASIRYHHKFSAYFQSRDLEKSRRGLEDEVIEYETMIMLRLVPSVAIARLAGMFAYAAAYTTLLVFAVFWSLSANTSGSPYGSWFAVLGLLFACYSVIMATIRFERIARFAHRLAHPSVHREFIIKKWGEAGEAEIERRQELREVEFGKLN